MTSQKNNGKILLKGGRSDVIVVKINGKERPLFILSPTEFFTSLTEFAVKYNLNNDMVITKFNLGLTLAEILAGKTIKDIPENTDGCFYERPETDKTPAKVDKKSTGFNAELSAALTGIPHVGVRCSYDGKDYISLKQCAEDYNVNPQTFYTRRSLGYSVHECLFGKSAKNTQKTFNPNKTMGKKVAVTIDGIPYESLGQFADAINVPRATVYARRMNNLPLSPKAMPYGSSMKKKSIIPGAKSISPAVVPNIAKLTEKPFMFHGKEYASEKDLVDTYNVSLDTYMSRKTKGLSTEECLFGKKIPGRSRRECEYNGIWYPSLFALTKCLGLDYDQFIEDIKVNNSIVASVVKQRPETFISEKRSGDVPITVDRIHYKSLADFAKKNFLNYNIVLERFRTGVSLSPLDKLYRNHGSLDEYIYRVCKKLNLDYVNFMKNKKKGMSFEDCYRANNLLVI